MAEYLLDAQQLLAQELRPALVIDSHGLILDTNHGSDRLIGASRLSAPEAQNPFIGQNISQVGLELRPRRPAILSTWSDLLDAAVHVTQLDDQQGATTANSIYTSSDEFWNAEYVRQGMFESDVHIARRNGEHSSTITARAIIHWVSRGLVDQGLFLVIFDRPFLPDLAAPDVAASDLSDGINTPEGASGSPSDAQPEEATLNTSRSREGTLSSEPNNALIMSKVNSTCPTNMFCEVLSPIHGIIGMSACLLDRELPKNQALIAQCIFENSKSLRATISDLLRTGQVQPSTMDEQPTPFVMQPPHKQKQKDAVVTWAGSMAKSATPRPAVPRNFAPPPQLDIHILLVERNAIMRKIMTKIAEKSGYRLNIVDTGQDALQYLCRSSQQPRPKVVLMNCTMQAPLIDGYEATRRIRNDCTIFDAETRSLPIIGLTILGQSDSVEKCLSAGMDDSLFKPLRVSVFKDKMIKWMVARKSYKAGHIVDAKL